MTTTDGRVTTAAPVTTAATSPQGFDLVYFAQLLTERPEVLQEALRLNRARTSFREFVRQAWPVIEPDPLVWNWHLDAICDHLEAVASGRMRRLIINIPPGHAKSMLVAVLWPAWIWIDRPEWRSLFATWQADLTLRDAMKCRALVESDWYRQLVGDRWKLRPDQNAKHYFVTTKDGSRFSTSVGGGTGHRGDMVVLDDPLSAMGARSKAERDEANTWITQAMLNRLNDLGTGRIVLIMQRLHEEDPTGFLLQAGKWQHLCLPSEFDPTRRSVTYDVDGAEFWRDPRQRDGELLFPEKFPAESLAAQRATLGADGYAGQYQQRPTPAEGGMFQRGWWRFWKPDGVAAIGRTSRPEGASDLPARALPSAFDSITISVDANFRATAGADPVSILVCGAKDGDRYILERQSGPFGFTRTVDVLLDVWGRWRKRCRKVLIETKANGDAILETVRRHIPCAVGIDPEGGKEARAWAIQPQVQAGAVHLPEGAPWLDEWISQFAAFPKGKHDDDVDALSQWLIDMQQSVTTADLWRRAAM